MDDIRDKLKAICDLLRVGHEDFQANQIEDALGGADSDITAYVTSNELWGGAGSVADQALIDKREARSNLETLMIDLGDLQMKKGMVNPRTEMWTSAFKEWQKKRP